MRIYPGNYVISDFPKFQFYREWVLEITQDNIRYFASLDDAMDFVYRALPFNILRAL